MDGASGNKRILHIEEGQHFSLEPGDELPYKLLRNLGQGGFANVEEVEDRHTGMVFAHKVLKFAGSSVERQRLFENEVRVIRRLSPHHHITRVFATYVGRRQIGILLTPVADRGSLDMFLQDALDGALTESELKTLYCSFGCLASGLRFMHAQKVRHKDIKPHNILVHKGSFIYTDFGSSLDYSAAMRSVTTGRPDSITRKYAAPELHEWSPRSSKTDIFSLACIFFEILGAVVLGQPHPGMTPYRDHIEEICKLMQNTSHECDDWIRLVIQTTCQMLNPISQARPSADTITSRLLMQRPDTFCGPCRTNLPIEAPTAETPLSMLDPIMPRDSWPGLPTSQYDIYRPVTRNNDWIFGYDVQQQFLAVNSTGPFQIYTPVKHSMLNQSAAPNADYNPYLAPQSTFNSRQEPPSYLADTDNSLGPGMTGYEHGSVLSLKYIV
jgi:serine/threonine protein kinase